MVNELKKKSLAELRSLAKQLKLKGTSTLRKPQLMEALLNVDSARLQELLAALTAETEGERAEQARETACESELPGDAGAESGAVLKEDATAAAVFTAEASEPKISVSETPAYETSAPEMSVAGASVPEKPETEAAVTQPSAMVAETQIPVTVAETQIPVTVAETAEQARDSVQPEKPAQNKFVSAGKKYSISFGDKSGGRLPGRGGYGTYAPTNRAQTDEKKPARGRADGEEASGRTETRRDFSGRDRQRVFSPMRNREGSEGSRFSPLPTNRFASDGARANRFSSDRAGVDRFAPETAGTDRFVPESAGPDRFAPDRAGADRFAPERAGADRFAPERAGADRLAPEGAGADRFAQEGIRSNRFAPEAGKSERQAPEQRQAAASASRNAESAQPEPDYSADLPSEELINSLSSGETAHGILEVMPDGYGFIRCANYMPGDNDVYVAPSQIRRFNMKTGDIITGTTKIKMGNEKFAALLYVTKINDEAPSVAAKRKSFEDLTPIFPNKRLRLETERDIYATRMVDLISPIGKGQRGMIVSPPKAGKTTLIKDIAKAVTQNHPEVHLIILLIDERPEEVTDIKEFIEGPNVEVIYSTFDEQPDHHKRVSEMVLGRAQRLVEHGRDVMILLDSITRLARAYNLTVTPSGRTLSGGLDPNALYMPKKFFGAARNMREGGSLTVLATALVDTGSRLDDMVFEEFKGTGNMELVLDRRLAERRVFPAVDLLKSGTRREDLLMEPEEQQTATLLRQSLGSSSKSDDATDRMLKLLKRTENNFQLCLNAASLLR